jgi:hypothetical protein
MEITATVTVKLMRRKKRSQRMTARPRRSPKRSPRMTEKTREKTRRARNLRTLTVKMKPRRSTLPILRTMRARKRAATL